MSPFYYFPKQAHVFWKHGGEMEILQVTGNFSFFHSVFYTSGELSAIFIKSANSFRLEEPEIFCLGTGFKYTVAT